MSINLEKINPPALMDASALGFSQITKCKPSELIHISGQVAWTSDGTKVPADIGEQAKIAMDNVAAALSSLGAGPDSVLSLRVYIVGLDDSAVRAASKPIIKYFGGQAPCLTMLGVAALVSPDLRIEIEATAAL